MFIRVVSRRLIRLLTGLLGDLTALLLRVHRSPVHNVKKFIDEEAVPLLNQSGLCDLAHTQIRYSLNMALLLLLVLLVAKLACVLELARCGLHVELVASRLLSGLLLLTFSNKLVMGPSALLVVKNDRTSSRGRICLLCMT